MPLTTGMALGPYEIVDALDAADSCESYLARDARDGHIVTLTALRATMGDAAAREEFTQRAQRLAELARAGVGGRFDVGREGDVDFFVEERTVVEDVDPGLPETAATVEVDPQARARRNGWIVVAASAITAMAAFGSWRLLWTPPPVPAQSVQGSAVVAPSVPAPPTPAPVERGEPPADSAPAPVQPAPPEAPVVPARADKIVYALPQGRAFTRTGRRVLAVSPDGTALAYVANQQIYICTADDETGRALAGSHEDPSAPFYSPDGRWLAYFTPTLPPGQQILKKIPASGGKSVTLGQFSHPLFGASWGEGAILVGSGSNVLSVPDKGGAPVLLVSLGAEELAALPQSVGIDDDILLTVLTRRPSGEVNWEDGRVVLLNGRTGRRRAVVDKAHSAALLPGNVLSFVHDRTLLVAPLDLEQGRTGLPESTVAGVAGVGPAQFAVSASGRLVYAPVGTSGAAESSVSMYGWLAGVQGRLSATPQR
jgi:hypothetical protein